MKRLSRELTITLNEEDWRKFVEARPNPVGWLVKQIQSSIREHEKLRS